MDEESDKSDAEGVKLEETSEQMAREPSPELARISALITRPPKQKSSSKRKNRTKALKNPLKNNVQVEHKRLISYYLFQNKPPILVHQCEMTTLMHLHQIEVIIIRQW